MRSVGVELGFPSKTRTCDKAINGSRRVDQDAFKVVILVMGLKRIGPTTLSLRGRDSGVTWSEKLPMCYPAKKKGLQQKL